MIPTADSVVTPKSSSQTSYRAPSARLSSFLIIFALWAVTYAAGMFTPTLLDDADTVHAEAAREMVLSHDWVTLRINDGVRYLEKAPLMYWSVATSYKWFGVHDWSTRLPLMLGILGLLLAVYRLGSYAFGERGGFWSAVVLGTSLGPYLFTRFLIPDTLVGLWLTLTFYFFLCSLDENQPSLWTCGGLAVCCALNVLTKGLIGMVFPIAVIGIFLIVTGNLKHLLRLRPVWSILVFFVVAAPWHVLAALRNPPQGQVRGFLWFYFVNEHFLRYLNKRMPRDYDTVPFLVFWGLILVWLVPWVAFLPQALRDVPLRWRDWWKGFDRRRRANLILFIWAAVILLFFSFSTRQEYYTIPAIPALALLVGGWLDRESEGRVERNEKRAGQISALVLLVVGILVFAAGMLVLSQSKAPPAGSDLADLLKKNPQDYAMSFGHFLDLTPQAMGAFEMPLAAFSIAFLLGTGLNWMFRRRGKLALANMSLVAMMIVVLFCVHSAFVTFSPILSSQKLAIALQDRWKPGDVVVVDGLYENASSLNFYTGIPLRSLHAPTGNMWYGAQFPDAPRIWETQSSFESLWTGSQRVFFWTDKDEPQALVGATRYLIAKSGGKSIFTNRPLK
jgi:4-amino-4-deoxy-L-arabinose transferase-like glycosyltransferase